MRRVGLVCIALVTVASIDGTVVPARQYSTLPVCRHDSRSTEADRARRAQALTLAKAINSAQADAVRRTQAYQPLSALPSLPDTPEGFAVKLYAGEDGYMFAIKDTRDPCHFAIFSDTAGLLYEKSARTAPIIAQ
ncbi:MAG TPA: hypothetical protein VGD94_00495 [Vicinamibacterales bacterium]